MRRISFAKRTHLNREGFIRLRGDDVGEPLWRSLHTDVGDGVLHVVALPQRHDVRSEPARVRDASDTARSVRSGVRDG